MSVAVDRKVVAVRTEVEVAADAVMAIFDSGLLGNSAHTLARVAEITQIPMAELREAWERIKRRGYRAPAIRAAAPTAPPPPTPPPTTPQGVGLARANQSRWAKKNPSPGQRTCSRCRETKAVVEFEIKNRRTGQMKSWCRPCTQAYQRERYITVADLGLVTRLRLLIEAGSPFLGEACASCGAALAAGEEIEACDVELRHTHCPTGAP